MYIRPTVQMENLVHSNCPVCQGTLSVGECLEQQAKSDRLLPPPYKAIVEELRAIRRVLEEQRPVKAPKREKA